MNNANKVGNVKLVDKGDTILLKNGNNTYFSFDKDALVGYESISINIGKGKNFSLDNFIEAQRLSDFYSEIPEVVLDIPSGDTVQGTIDWGLENGMLNVYHLDTDGIVDPEDQLSYYLIGNPNDATPWDPSTGGRLNLRKSSVYISTLMMKVKTSLHLILKMNQLSFKSG